MYDGHLDLSTVFPASERTTEKEERERERGKKTKSIKELIK
jgi:hypothetical protein